MQLSRLTTGEMVSLSQTYLDAEHPANHGLVSMPEAASLLPRLRDAHAVLVASQSADDLRASALQNEVAVLHSEHDALAQGIDGLLQGMALLVEQDDLRQRWTHMHELLLPGGRKLSTAPHQEAAESAALLEQTLSGMPSQEKNLLKSQFIGKRSLFEIVGRFIIVGKELGQKEIERQSVPVTPSEGALLEARNQWTRTVGAIVAMLQMARLLGELPAGVEQYVLAPLSAATDRRVVR